MYIGMCVCCSKNDWRGPVLKGVYCQPVYSQSRVLDKVRLVFVCGKSKQTQLRFPSRFTVKATFLFNRLALSKTLVFRHLTCCSTDWIPTCCASMNILIFFYMVLTFDLVSRLLVCRFLGTLDLWPTGLSLSWAVARAVELGWDSVPLYRDLSF